MCLRLPEALGRGLSAKDKAVVEEWWRALEDEQRAALLVVFQGGRRLRGRLFALPEAVHEAASQARQDEGSVDDLYEFLVNHELFAEPATVAHICTAEPEARSALASRRLPASFRCPRGLSTCPMRSILAAARGQDVAIACVAGRPPHG